jgi:outer membrane protein OmpA-like peptidoglycan-associated protein
MRLTRTLKWSAALVLVGLGGVGSTGCAAKAQIVAKAPPPPPPPPKDSDGDGIPDNVDKCPNQPEDKDGFQDADGCPDPDNDGDGIPDAKDKCPNEPETFNGYQDADGCPDKKPIVQIVGTKVQINQKIQFAKNSAALEDSSTPVLDAVADTLKKHPGIQLLEVGGHASKEGAAGYNVTLTQKRVESVVKALEDRGIDDHRLIPQGYGYYCPLDTGTSEEAMEKNRRVEFSILRRGGKDTHEKRGCDAAFKAGIKLHWGGLHHKAMHEHGMHEHAMHEHGMHEHEKMMKKHEHEMHEHAKHEHETMKKEHEAAKHAAKAAKKPDAEPPKPVAEPPQPAGAAQ